MTVQLYSNDSRLVKAVIQAVAPVPVAVHAVGVKSFPSTVDAIVTLGQISRDTEVLAMTLKASSTVVLPEAEWWLSERCEDGRITSLAGSDLSRTDKVF